MAVSSWARASLVCSWLLACTRAPAEAPRDAEQAAPPPPAAPVDPEPAMPASITSVEVDGLESLSHRPLLVLTEENPYLMVDGSDVPRLVAYQDGLVVFHGGRRSVQLTPERVREFVASVATPEFLELPVLTRVRDRGGLPTIHIGLRLGSRWKYVAVYGLPLGIVVLREGEAPPEGPPGFMAAYGKVLAFEAPEAGPWTPETVEVMLWDFSHSRDESPWPADVPAPPADLAPPMGKIHKHEMPGKHEAALTKFLASLPETRAVGLNGYRWSVDVRRIVPGEGYIRDVQQCVIKQTLMEPPMDAGPRCHVHRAQ